MADGRIRAPAPTLPPLNVLDVTLPFFALVFLGWLAGRRRMLPGDAVPALNAFVLWFALPAMLFGFAARSPIGTLLNAPVFAAYAVAGALLLAGTALVLRRAGKDWKDAAMGALGAAWSNWGYMGFAMIPALLGEAALAPLIAAGVADMTLIVSLALALAAQDGAADGPLRALREALRGVARNPLVWAIVAGVAASATGLQLPVAAARLLQLLGASAGPVALFAMGLALAAPVPRGDGRAVAALSSVKLLLHPLLVAALCTWVFGLAAREREALVLMAALPTAGTVFLFAERLGAGAARIAALILWSTLAACASFPLLASLLGAG